MHHFLISLFVFFVPANIILPSFLSSSNKNNVIREVTLINSGSENASSKSCSVKYQLKYRSCPCLCYFHLKIFVYNKKQVTQSFIITTPTVAVEILITTSDYKKKKKSQIKFVNILNLKMMIFFLLRTVCLKMK